MQVVRFVGKVDQAFERGEESMLLVAKEVCGGTYNAFCVFFAILEFQNPGSCCFFFQKTAGASVSKEMKDAAIDAARKSRESGFQEEQPWKGWL